MATETPATPATPAVEPASPTPYDEMADVFDGLMEPEQSPSEDGAPSTEKVEDKAAPAAEPTSPEAPAETPPEEPTAATPAATPPEEPPAEPSEEAIDWKARFEALQAEKAQAPAPAAPEPQAPPEEPQPPAEIYDASEKEFLAKYAEEWPDIVRGEALRRRAEYNHLVQHIFSQINQTYGPLIERGVQAADTVAEDTSLRVIQASHADYDDEMYEKVIDWANHLTGTRQRVAKEIIENGSPQEVVELITEYKSANGIKPRVVAGGAPATPAAPVKTGLSAKAKQAAQAMSVVDSKRSTLTPAADPTDFDAGWEDAVGGK